MPNVRLAGRYAKSLIDLAQEKGQLDQVYADMKFLEGVCKHSKEFIQLLKSPVVKTDKKQAIVKAVTTGKVRPLTEAFNHLLAQKGRESNLPEIVAAFIEQYNEIKGIHTVTITTAIPVGDDLKSAIQHKITSTTPMKNVEMNMLVKPELIGGFILEYKDKMVDVSISRDLKDIKMQFKSNLYIKKAMR